MVQRFVRGVIQGDRDAVASAVSYPLEVQGKRHFFVRNKAQLIAHWDEIVTPFFVAAMRKAVPHEMFVHDGMAMLSNGIAWFDEGGAKLVRPGD